MKLFYIRCLAFVMGSTSSERTLSAQVRVFQWPPDIQYFESETVWYLIFDIRLDTIYNTSSYSPHVEELPNIGYSNNFSHIFNKLV